MKSLVDLLVDLLHDCGRRCNAPTMRDAETLLHRAEHEGDSFITITLSSFCRDFERSLDAGRVVPGSFLSFGKTRSGIPEFLQGFLHQVFSKDCVLLSNPSVDCVFAVRQICLFGKKIERPCDDARLRDAITSFIECDDGIVTPTGQMFRYFKYVASILMPQLVNDVNFVDDIVPKHGPGATREHILGNQKYVFRRWHTRLDDVGFTHTKFAACSPSLDEDHSPPVAVEPWDEEPVRVCLVPKTLKAPRVIAIEPVCMQYAQQALLQVLVKGIERSPFTSGHVNFTDQGVNQEQCRKASIDGLMATIDMSDASDRVSGEHVLAMLESVPRFRDWVFACRSMFAELPDGRRVCLKKFASMGSALCFPMEALVFYMTIIASRILRDGRFPTRRLVKKYSRDVYVYGDDLIFPADEAFATCEDLESMGFKVSRQKSFWTGKFRESCGSDYYDGHLVTPVYFRRDLPKGRRDSSGIVSAVETCNQLYRVGLVKTAATLRRVVERIIGVLPMIPAEHPAIGFEGFGEAPRVKRWNALLQRFEYLCWLIRPSYVADPLSGDAALVKCLRLIGLHDRIDRKHLERSPRRHGLALKRGWVPLY